MEHGTIILLLVLLVIILFGGRVLLLNGLNGVILLINQSFIPSFRNLKLTRITQAPKMQLEDLFAQFGGYLGLLTGVSVITILEFVEVFLSSFYRAFLNKCSSKKDKEEQEAAKEMTTEQKPKEREAWTEDFKPREKY